MLLNVLLLLPLVGCDRFLPGSSDTPVAATAPPPKDLVAELGEVRLFLLAGKTPEAAKAAEALLTKYPEADNVWDLVELTAVRAGTARDLVDRLSADQAIGGRVDRHHALRGALAVEASRLGDALNAAKALEPIAPGDAAAIVASAVAKGAPVPAGLSNSAAALVAASNPSNALDPAADSLPGWRAALVRAEARLARGDRTGAAVEAAKADAGGVRARGLSAELRVRAAGSGDEAWGVVDTSARAIFEAGDVVGVAELMDAALPVLLADWKARGLVDLASELRGKIGNKQGTVHTGAAALAAVEADAALRAGLPVRARDAATVAITAPESKVRGAWALTLASAALGSAAAVEAAAAGLPEPRAAAARDLIRALRGQEVTLPTRGLDGADAALQALLGAGWQPNPGAAYAAAAAAVGSTAPDLALWASLAADRAPLKLPESASPALRSEQAARSWLAEGGGGSLPDTTHPFSSGWTALMGGAPAAPDATGVAAWARGRAALTTGNNAGAEKEYSALAAACPPWRSGPWAPLLVLDGPLTDDLAPEAADNAAAADPLPFAVFMHALAAREASARAPWRHGVSPLPGSATPEQETAVWSAAAGLRAGVLAWAAGRDAWPTAAAAELLAAEHAAGLVPHAPPSLAALRSTLQGDVLLSFRPVANGIEALYLGETKGRIETLPASVARQTEDFLAALRTGDSAIPAGDRLRSQVIDPAMDVLIGVGRYTVIGESPMGLFPIAALPEQADGLRFLAAIRHVGYLPTLDAVLPDRTAVVEGDVAMLALCADSVEAMAVRRVYPDAVLLEGPTATLAAFRKDAPRARFLHLGAFPPSPDGGFQLADGPLTLGEIASTPITARNAVIAGAVDTEVTAGRLAALRAAGVPDVLVEGWGAPGELRAALLQHFWEGINRRYSASHSLSESRTLSLREAGEPARLPGSWAGYFVSGRP